MRWRSPIKLFISPIALCSLILAAGPHAARAAGLLVADGGLGGALEIKEHSAKVTINNGIAVTEVTQIFLNTENRPVEALYMFPVPRGASVSNFAMWINGKEMTGEVLEKQKARQIYESYKQKRRDPGLLEQTDYRTFEMRVFPIAPRAEQKVQVTYCQELDFDHDWATYVYPLATQTRRDTNSRTSGKFALTLDVKSEIPIVELTSPSHPKEFAIAKHGESYQQASLETKSGDLSRDVVLAYHVSRPHTGIDLITSRQNGEDGYFCLTLTTGQELDQIKSAMDYVFVLDISGSMNDDGKLDASRKSLAAFIEALGPEDRFEVITFNVEPHTLFASLKTADDASKAQARQFLDSQRAVGGTVLNPALATAYKYADATRPLNVIIMSDGLTEQAERATLVQAIRNRPALSHVFAVGVGNDVNRPLLEQLANDSGGMAAFLSRGDDFQRQAQAFRRKLQRPIATDVAIDFKGVDVYDIEPKQLPNLYHGMPVRMYGRYKGDGKATATLAGKIGDRALSTNVELEFPQADDTNPQIERMWAWHRVDRLLKQADADGARSQSVLDEIVRLGEGYSIATEYTSFIVLENDAEYQRWAIERKNALRVQRDRKSAEALAAKLQTMRERAAEALGPMDASKPAKGSPTVSAQQVTDVVPASPSASPRGRDVNWSVPTGNSGGAAIDPITFLAAIGMILLVVIAKISCVRPRGNFA